jgi:hypothetical protein
VGVCAVALKLAFAHQRLTLRWLVSFYTDYTNPEAFSENLVKCM